MNKLCLLSCLALAVSAHAQTKPKVVFVGDQFTYAWQQSAAFKANPNWTGAGTPLTFSYGNSGAVAAAFPAVLSQHPDYVFLQTGQADLAEGNSSATKWGMQFEGTAIGIIEIVQMAKRANVKIIIGNLIGEGFTNGWLQAFAQNENIPIVNFADVLNVDCPSQCPLLGGSSPSGEEIWDITVPNVAGFQVITQMAQTAIATYSLKIKGGYLSDVEVSNGLTASGPTGYPPIPPTSINSVQPGATLQFTPQATWTDGVTRPMTNVPYGGVLGTWWSTNPKVVAVDQHGFASAYTPGTATIWFQSATGQTFSPWGMTVIQWYSGIFDIPAPVY
jgi:hypothetical protein